MDPLLLFGVALCFLSKASSVTFALPLLTYSLVVLFITRRQIRPATRVSDLAILIAALVVAGATVTWYRVNWQHMVFHFVESTTGDFAQYFGSPVNLPVKLKYWTLALSTSLSPFAAISIAILALVTIAIAIATARVLKSPPAKWAEALVLSGTLFALASVGTVVVTILTYSLQINEDRRFLMPLIPLIGVLMAWSLEVVRYRFVAAAFLVGFVGNSVIDHLFAHGADPFHLRGRLWSVQVQRNPENKILLTEAVRATCRRDTADRINVIGVDYSELNVNTINFFSVKARDVTGYYCPYRNLGSREIDVQRALDRISRQPL